MSPSATRVLASGRVASAFQKEWFADVRRRAADGEPLAVVAVDTPHEVLRAMDIPYVVAPWWSSLCGSRGLAQEYLALLAGEGYPSGRSQYGALGFASSLSPHPEEGPWGGLPTPSLFIDHGVGDANHRILQLWARQAGAPLFTFERTGGHVVPERWWETAREGWDSVFDRRSMDLMTTQVDELTGWLRARTGRTFDRERLAEVMDRSNEQGDWFSRARDALAGAERTPAGIGDTIPAAMIPQWHLGSEWGRDAARAFAEECERLVEERSALVENQRLRLMWIGNPLWFDMSLYERFQESHGAVFVWSIYLAIAADGYIRRGGDPVRAVAARHAFHGDLLNAPQWSTPWYVHEARHNRVDAVVHMNSDAGRGAYLIRKELERAGFPVLEVDGNAVDGGGSRSERIADQISLFLDGLVR